jgi:hypothetical protein
MEIGQVFLKINSDAANLSRLQYGHHAQIMLSLQAYFNKYSLYEAKTGIYMGCLFYHSLSTVGLSYAKPLSAGISRDDCRVQKNHRKRIMYSQHIDCTLYFGSTSLLNSYIIISIAELSRNKLFLYNLQAANRQA